MELQIFGISWTGFVSKSGETPHKKAPQTKMKQNKKKKLTNKINDAQNVSFRLLSKKKRKNIWIKKSLKRLNKLLVSSKEMQK